MFYKSVTNDITMLLFLYMLSVLTLFHVFLLLYIVFFRGCWSYYGSVWGREKICFATFPVWFIQWSHSKQYTPNPFMQLTSERNVKKKSRVDCKINPIFLHDKRHKLNKKKAHCEKTTRTENHGRVNLTGMRLLDNNFIVSQANWALLCCVCGCCCSKMASSFGDTTNNTDWSLQKGNHTQNHPVGFFLL